MSRLLKFGMDELNQPELKNTEYLRGNHSEKYIDLDRIGVQHRMAFSYICQFYSNPHE